MVTPGSFQGQEIARLRQCLDDQQAILTEISRTTEAAVADLRVLGAFIASRFVIPELPVEVRRVLQERGFVGEESS